MSREKDDGMGGALLRSLNSLGCRLRYRFRCLLFQTIGAAVRVR